MMKRALFVLFALMMSILLIAVVEGKPTPSAASCQKYLKPCTVDSDCCDNGVCRNDGNVDPTDYAANGLGNLKCRLRDLNTHGIDINA